MKKFEIIQKVFERTIVEASSEEEALEMFYNGETKIESYPSVKGGDDLQIKEIK